MVAPALKALDGPPRSTQVANLLLCGHTGRQLMEELRTRFPTVSREEMFFAVVLAWTIREADLVELELELSIARALLAKATAAEPTERAA